MIAALRSLASEPAAIPVNPGGLPFERRSGVNHHHLLFMGAAGLSAIAWGVACGDFATAPPPPVPPPAPRPTSLAVTPATAVLPASGATLQLSAEVRDQDPQVMAGAAVACASGNVSVATGRRADGSFSHARSRGCRGGTGRHAGDGSAFSPRHPSRRSTEKVSLRDTGRRPRECGSDDPGVRSNCDHSVRTLLRAT